MHHNQPPNLNIFPSRPTKLGSTFSGSLARKAPLKAYTVLHDSYDKLHNLQAVQLFVENKLMMIQIVVVVFVVVDVVFVVVVVVLLFSSSSLLLLLLLLLIACC